MSERRRRRAARGWTTEQRLRSLVFVCWAILLAFCVTSVAALELQSENIRRLTLVDGPAVDANIQVRQAMTDAQVGLNGYQTSGDRGLLQPYFGTQERTMSALATLQRLGLEQVDDAERQTDLALRARQRQAVDQWWANAIRIQQTLDNGGRADLFESKAIFARYSQVSRALGDALVSDQDEARLAARALSTRVEAVSILATFVALLAMLVLGRRVAGTISWPLVEMRDTMVRQRMGEPGAHAREDQGSVELRSVARDFNALTEQNVALQQIQARDLSTQEVTLAVGRAIRAASDTQEALEVMCDALGRGLGADRVMANTLGAEHHVQLAAQWNQPDLEPLTDLTDLLDLPGIAEQLWLAEGFQVVDDLLLIDLPSQEVRTFFEVTGGRAGIVVSIGLDDRVIGVIHVLMVGRTRAWTIPEANVIQAVAGFVARAVVAVEHQAYQREHLIRMEKLDRQKSDFLATVSHELRTPLTSISGYVELLQEQDAGELTAQQLRMLEVISRNTVRLRSLIEDVMVLSRVEGGVNKADFVEVSIRELITRVGEELSLVAQGGGVELDIHVGSRAAVVLGDRASLDRAVVNILANAIKFSRRGGVVTLRSTLDRSARRVLITCQDHGVGIPAQDIPDLFTRFFRASNATEQAIPGTGLGLSIAKQIVEEHHDGTLRLTSVEMEGTSVVMDLPMYEPSQTQESECSPQEQEAAGNAADSDDVFGIRA